MSFVSEAPAVRAVQIVLIAAIVSFVVFVAILFVRADAGGPQGGDGDCFPDSGNTMTCVMP